MSSEAEFLSRVMYMGRGLDLLMHHALNRCPGCGLVLPSGTPGFPDVVAVGPGGLLLRELKTRAGIMSPAQKRFARTIGDTPAAGAIPLFSIWRDPVDRVSGRIGHELAAIT